jgi:hypothetical protein
MISGDNGEMGELEDGSAEDRLAAPAEAHEPIPKWYRGDLNGAYQKWREGGKPEDPAHPLTRELLSEAHLFANRSTQKARSSSQALNNDESENSISAENEESIQRAMLLYDPDREGAGSFTTYVKRAILNNIRDELRRGKRPTHQAELLRAYNGDREVAHWWIDEETNRGWGDDWEPVISHNIAPKDRPLAHWLLDQGPNTKITWRQVLSAFPVYKTDDTAGRALKRVKKAIEKARFYRF